MIQCINVHNVNQALSEGLLRLKHGGVRSPSRNGEVLMFPGPVVTTYNDPTARVLFSPLRDANPFFHLMEALWMLAGRNDLEWCQRFVSTFDAFSDDGVTLWGAYGHRWREHFGYDQLRLAIAELKRDPATRRVVIAMWDGGSIDRAQDEWDSTGDLHKAMNGGKDVPCNTHIYFDCRGGALNMTVCNRSNDMIWGAYGANAVHMSILQEYVAGHVGIPVGLYHQFSNNLHVYLDKLPVASFEDWADDARQSDLYTQPLGLMHRVPASDAPQRVPLVGVLGADAFDTDLALFFEEPCRPIEHYATEFFNYVASPVYQAHYAFKQKHYAEAADFVRYIHAEDWRIACSAWLGRRARKRREKEAATLCIPTAQEV